MVTVTQDGDGNIISRDIINSEVQVMVGGLNDAQVHDVRVQRVLAEIKDFEQRLVNTRSEHEQRALLSAVNNSLERYAFFIAFGLWVLGIIAMLGDALFTVVTVGLPIFLIIFGGYQFYLYIGRSAQRRTLIKQYKGIIQQKKDELGQIIQQMKETS